MFAIAIMAGGGLAYATYNFMQNQPVKAVATPTQPVIVAAADLQLGAELKKDDLTVMNFPKGPAPEGSFSQVDQLLGRGLVVPVIQNEPILDAKLASKEAGAGLPPVIPQGMRAVSVRVNEVIGVAGYVLPGNARRRRRHARARPSARRHHLEGDAHQRPGARRRHEDRAGHGQGQAGAGQRGDPAGRIPNRPSGSTLASTEGKIQLALRNPLDQGAPETPGIKAAGLLGGVRAPLPTRPASSVARAKAAPQPQTMTAPAPPPLPTVEIIRGDKRATEVIR